MQVNNQKIKVRVYPNEAEEKVNSISKYWESMESLRMQARMNQSFQNCIATLAQKFCGWRRVRGDGNCYYRSVISRYFLKIFNVSVPIPSEITKFQSVLKSIDNVPNKTYDTAKEFISKFVDYAIPCLESIGKRIELYKNVNVLLQDEEFDLHLVRVARLITLDAFLKKSEDIIAFMPEEDKPLFMNRIMNMGEEAEGVELSLMPIGLDICVNQFNLFGEDIIENNYPNEDAKFNKLKISIICKLRGHYDMLYSIEEMEQEEYDLSSAIYFTNH